MESDLFNDFELSLQTFLNSVVNDMNNQKSINTDSLLDIWHNHNNDIRNKVVELTFSLIESHGIDQNSIKASEKSLHTEILTISTEKSKQIVDKMYNDKIKSIIYQSLTNWKS